LKQIRLAYGFGTASGFVKKNSRIRGAQKPTDRRQFKGIVSRDFVVCFLVSFNRYEVPTHMECVLLLLKFRFRVEFLDFCISAYKFTPY
jgi:hypothetical protein